MNHFVLAKRSHFRFNSIVNSTSQPLSVFLSGGPSSIDSDN